MSNPLLPRLKLILLLTHYCSVTKLCATLQLHELQHTRLPCLNSSTPPNSKSIPQPPPITHKQEKALHCSPCYIIPISQWPLQLHPSKAKTLELWMTHHLLLYSTFNLGANFSVLLIKYISHLIPTHHLHHNRPGPATVTSHLDPNCSPYLPFAFLMVCPPQGNHRYLLKM